MTSSAGPMNDGGTSGFASARLKRIDQFFECEVAAGHIPGAVLLIERRGETVLKSAWGYRDRVGAVPMTLDTIFRIYSMTKPLVSLVTLMLAAEGRFALAQPVSDFIPTFANLKVFAYGALMALERPPTVHDLLRHTAGLTYPRNGGPVSYLYREANLLSGDITNEEFVERIATLPLAHQPGRVFDYSHATDVLGRVVETVTGQPLGAVLRERLIDPLRMVDTGFVVPPSAHHRVAEPLPGDTFIEDGRPLFDPRKPRLLQAGGMGLVSTLEDYARFARMLLAGGTRAKHTYVSKKLFRFMTADHIGPSTGIARLPGSILSPAFGFGLGFAVRTELGGASFPGSVGEFNWSGVGGTYFWVDPAERLIVILLMQSPRHRERYRQVLKTMVYNALVGEGVPTTVKKPAKLRQTV